MKSNAGWGVRVICLALVAAFVARGAAGQPRTPTRSVFGALTPGTHAIGFRMLIERDTTRPALPGSSDQTARVMPIAIWYPSETGGTAPLRFRDYVAATDVALSGLSGPSAAVIRFTADIKSRGAGDAPIDSLLDVGMLAVRDAAAERGRFPLVLFAHASPESQSIMSEYLASHGFVVAAIRSRAASDLAYRLSRENLDAMVGDLGFVWTRMQQESNVRPGAAGVIGMSNGSIGAVALQLRAPIVAGIVSLDGGIGEDAGGVYLRERSEGDVARLRAPILHFYAPNNPHLNLSHLQSYQAANRTLIFVRGMRHPDFLNYAMFNTVVPGIDGSTSADARPGFEWITQYTRRFLESLLNNDRAAADWLAGDPASRGVPTGLFSVQRLTAGTADEPQSSSPTPAAVANPRPLSNCPSVIRAFTALVAPSPPMALM